MNYTTNSVNKSECPLRHSPLPKSIALAATIAMLFWSLQANAYPLHNGDYLFWPEMPEAAKVLADVKGKNNVDTAGRQHAALTLLIALVNMAADGTGQTPWPARERELKSSYLHALPDVNGPQGAEIKAQSLRLQADQSFVQPFLKRYFSEAALSEVSTMIASYEAGAQRQIKREADTQRQTDTAYAQTVTQESNEFRKIEEAGLQSQKQEKETKIIFYSITGVIFVLYVALGIASSIQWIFMICRAFKTIRTTSADPPGFEGPWKNQKIESFTGRVRGSATRSDTTVSGSIYTVMGNQALGVGNRVEGRISSKTTVTDKFRLVDPRNQQEENFVVQDYDLQIWEDQLVSVAWTIPENQTKGPVFLVVNHTASNAGSTEIFTSRADLWEVASPRYRRLMNWGILTWIFCPPIYVLVLFWAILMNVQTGRFGRSGIQPLVEALNRKAKEFS